jgi:hypothetical protein
MAEFLPLDKAPAVETTRRRTLQVGARLEQQSLAAKPLVTPPSAQSIAVSIDGGHVKSIRSYQMRSFEVMLACTSNDQGEQQLFSSVPVEADRQRQQLSAVLRDLGATPKRQIQLTAAYLKKLTGVLQDLETYVSGQFFSIINYAAARRSAEPISTAPTESVVHRLLHRRMTAKQQMRWSPRGAHFMLKVRTAVVNGTFERDHISLGKSTRFLQRRAA